MWIMHCNMHPGALSTVCAFNQTRSNVRSNGNVRILYMFKLSKGGGLSRQFSQFKASNSLKSNFEAPLEMRTRNPVTPRVRLVK